MEAMGYDAKKFIAEMGKFGWKFGRKKIDGKWVEVLWKKNWKPAGGQRCVACDCDLALTEADTEVLTRAVQ